jgi:hypothetical protein
MMIIKMKKKKKMKKDNDWWKNKWIKNNKKLNKWKYFLVDNRRNLYHKWRKMMIIKMKMKNINKNNKYFNMDRVILMRLKKGR